jgi:cytochrome c-type biogenesis protein CcmF|tara:strand:- start:7 stop:516 length:510 start_codon:yes stop_codon:yes gene_type:complete
MTLAHLGLSLFICGAVADSAWRTEVVINAKERDKTSIAGFDAQLKTVDRLEGPNYHLERATIVISKNGKYVTTVFPERRFYPVQQMPTTEAAIYTTFLADIYVSLGEGGKDQGWTLRLWYNPLIPWIWAGCLIMVLGGLISLSDRRLRIGAPFKRADKKAQEDGLLKNA